MDQLEKDIEEAEAELEALVQEGLDSGSGEEMMRGDFESIRREMHAQHSSKGK